jgi:nitroreductase
VNVSEALARRFSVRAFKPDPVPGAIVREILSAARRAPSGGNLQPWRIYVLGGEALAAFKKVIADKIARGISETPEYNVYPPSLWEPLRSRRREVGALRYAALGVADKDKAGQEALTLKNYEFFGAPVGLFFCLDRRCGPPQWSDVGMYMLTVMLLAVERGLDTCPQESWSNWPKAVAAFLELPEEMMLFAGMSMGYLDETHPLNRFRTPRAELAEFAEFRGLPVSGG